MLFYITLSLYCTPFNALIPELGRSQEDRINLSTYISVTYFVGTAAAYLVTAIVFARYNEERVLAAILARGQEGGE